jgi:hypothetical protein
MLEAGKSTIGFRCLDKKRRVASQRQQIMIAADQQVCTTALCQVEKGLIV